MNPLYQALTGGTLPQQSAAPPLFNNPMQRATYIMQAMQNPAMFVKQYFPDIPAEISNDPGRILMYLKETRGISDQQIQQLQQMVGQLRR